MIQPVVVPNITFESLSETEQAQLNQALLAFAEGINSAIAKLNAEFP